MARGAAKFSAWFDADLVARPGLAGRGRFVRRGTAIRRSSVLSPMAGVPGVGVAGAMRIAYRGADEDIVDLCAHSEPGCCSPPLGHTKLERVVRCLGIEIMELFRMDKNLAPLGRPSVSELDPTMLRCA